MPTEAKEAIVYGSVKWFSPDKGYGYILGEKGARDIFFHYSVIDMHGFKNLQEGDLVEYTYEIRPKGPAALYVKRKEGTV